MPPLTVSDVMRYVAVARRALAGPLAVEIDGPGDPLANPETVLRSLSLLHEHHPDVVTGLAIDGPLLAEYVEELVAFGLRYLVVRMDAARPRTQRRLVEGAVYRGERLGRNEAAALVLEDGPRALCLARRNGIPAAVRLTLVPTVNGREVREVAQRARDQGAERMDVLAHDPVPGTRLARAGSPTPHELGRAREAVAEVFGEPAASGRGGGALAWLTPDRLQAVDVDLLEAVDVLRILPDPYGGLPRARVLPPRRAQLIAVATRDGGLVDQALHRCHLLRIYAVTAQSVRCVGSRILPLDPRRRQDGVGDAQAFLAALVGCRALVATHVPRRAVTLLRAVGVLPVAQGGPVEDVLDRVARGTVHAAEASLV